MSQMTQLLESAQKQITQSNDLTELDKIRVSYLGKKGQVTDLLKGLKDLSPEERKAQGQIVNEIKQQLEALLLERKEKLSLAEDNLRLQKEQIDVTLPGRKRQQGSLHPISITLNRITDIFKTLGFSVELGPEIEDEYYNFESLNIPSHHPARAMHDTFYFPDGKLLRTHTSPVQIRTMEKSKPPLRIIAPGRVYRCDSDVTHTPMFHQVEGLLIDKGISFAHLKGIIDSFLKAYFGDDVATRFRPSYFPFTEPSAEVDIQCVHCSGAGCRICKKSGWLEVLGCGMVHPSVLKYGRIDPKVYSGFAFGLGVERFAMLTYGVDDLRAFFENDLRMLKQFPGV